MNEKFLAERALCPVFDKYAYLLTGATGPIPTYVYEGVKDYMDRRLYEGGDAIFRGEGTFTMIARVRGVFAELLGCKPEDIAFGSNTSQMLCIFTEGLRFQPGDNVVTTRDAFISVVYALDMLRREGLEIRYVDSIDGVVPTQSLLDACDERTKAVIISHVESFTGYRHDLAAIGEFTRAHGIWLAIDAAHSCGVLPIDVTAMKVDFLCGNDYKWMMNFCGVGYAYISEPLRAALTQRSAGWLSVKRLFASGLFEVDLAEGASRYEKGYPFAPGIFTMGEVASHYLALGKAEVEEYVLSLAQYFYDSVREIKQVVITSEFPKGHASALASINVPARFGITEAALKEKGVCATVHEAHDPDGMTQVRASCHYVNTKEDIDRLVAALKELLA